MGASVVLYERKGRRTVRPEAAGRSSVYVNGGRLSPNNREGSWSGLSIQNFPFTSILTFFFCSSDALMIPGSDFQDLPKL